LEHEKDSSSSSQNSPEPRGLLYILLSSLAFACGWFSARLHDPNQHVSETAPSQSSTAGEGNRGQFEPIVVSQVAPAPIETYLPHRREDNTPRWKKIAEWSIAGATVGLLIVNIFLWSATKKAADAADKSAGAAGKAANAAEESLTTVQRAYISLGDIGGSRNGVSSDPKTISLMIKFPWENAGYTPTREMKTHVSRNFYKNGLPKDWNFPDLWNGPLPHNYTTVVASPRGKVIYTIGMNAEDIEKVRSHQSRLFFWGWAHYRDVFDKTSPHVTEFCVELIGFLGNPFSPNVNEPVSPIFSFCDSHNCQDQECKAN
jgi:hypothetical protein